MHNIQHAAFLLLFQYLGFISAAPTSNTAPDLTLFQPANAISNNSYTRNITLESLFTPIIYPIPSSTITLSLNPIPQFPLPPSNLSVCLLATSQRIHAHIRQHGDGPLAAVDDPFTSDPFPDINCRFSVWSMRTAGQSFLTYGTLGTVLSGLLEWMLWPDPHYLAVSFLIREEGRGVVGQGHVGSARR